MQKEGIRELFYLWIKQKYIIHNKKFNKKLFFREREIWWLEMEKNVGVEINGKNTFFERPVLVLKKYNKEMCFVLPLTTQIKYPLPSYQIKILTQGKEKSAVNLTQGRCVSSKRLLRKIKTIDKATYNTVVYRFKDQFKIH